MVLTGKHADISGRRHFENLRTEELSDVYVSRSVDGDPPDGEMTSAAVASPLGSPPPAIVEIVFCALIEQELEERSAE